MRQQGSFDVANSVDDDQGLAAYYAWEKRERIAKAAHEALAESNDRSAQIWQHKLDLRRAASDATRTARRELLDRVPTQRTA